MVLGFRQESVLVWTLNLGGYFVRQVIELFRDSGFLFVPGDSNPSALYGRLLVEAKE